MIAVNELRVGNWVDDSKGNYYQFKRLDFSEQVTNLSVTMPIPLTPEILEKAGFVKIPNNDEYNDMRLELNNELTEYELDYYGVGVSLFHKKLLIGEITKYLHQLQNLYFALTGEELNIQL